MLKLLKKHLSRKKLKPTSELNLEQGEKLKYYLYISETKVRMLFPQIPSKFLEGASADIKFNLGLISSTIKSDTQGSAQGMPQKLACACKYLVETEQVGDENSTSAYIGGAFPFRYGAVSENASDIAFFGEIVNGIKIGLIGATSSLIGEVSITEANHAPFYYTLKFLNQITEAGNETNESPGYDSYLSAFETALNTIPKKKQNLEFIAKVLHRENGLIIATPLYVALAE